MKLPYGQPVSYLDRMIEKSPSQLVSNQIRHLPSAGTSRYRALAIFSAVVALGDDDTLGGAIASLKLCGVPRTELYEIILQSYLFLGFPRTLIAAEALSIHWPAPADPYRASKGTEYEEWKVRGEELYKKVYGNNASRLQDRVTSFAPEIFDWMIAEGYGKVLSRPGLGIVERELAVVAALIVENRPKQLMSHLRGALLVGATNTQIKAVIGDLESIAPIGAAVARRLAEQLGVRL